jgi:hypothetical protein
MFFLKHFDDLRLDIVGIVAVLGEGSVTELARITSLSWHHILPRLMPAPQALLNLRHDDHLPFAEGITISVSTGKTQHAINFFCRSLRWRRLEPYEVEFVHVERKPASTDEPAFRLEQLSTLGALSLFGTLTSITILGLSIHYQDGWALLGTILLSVTSTSAGLASRSSLQVPSDASRPDRIESIPGTYIVISYPNGAFRVVYCNERTSRLYLVPDNVQPLLSADMQRILGLGSTLTLIAGLICLGNSQQILQLTFATAYILLNISYWFASTISAERYTIHPYMTNVVRIKEPGPNPSDGRSGSSVGPSQPTSNASEPKIYGGDVEAAGTPANAPQFTGRDWSQGLGNIPLPRRRHTFALTQTREPVRAQNFTSALWKVIAITGSARWLQNQSIVPQNPVWEAWLSLADERVRSETCDRAGITDNYDGTNSFELPSWQYQHVLRDLFYQEKNRR